MAADVVACNTTEYSITVYGNTLFFQDGAHDRGKDKGAGDVASSMGGRASVKALFMGKILIDMTDKEIAPCRVSSGHTAWYGSSREGRVCRICLIEGGHGLRGNLAE